MWKAKTFGEQIKMMHIEDGKIVFDFEKCDRCWGDGLGSRKVKCKACRGTGKGPRGGKNTCRKCAMTGCGYVYIRDGECSNCVGKGLSPEAATMADRYSYVPESLWKGLTFKVYRSNRPQTGNENMLGVGSAWCTTDYGAHKSLSDEQLIEEVRNRSGGVQACKVCDENNIVADHIGIFCSNLGYRVQAVYGDHKDVEAVIARERTTSDYLNTGRRIADDGGNGTLAAIFK